MDSALGGGVVMSDVARFGVMLPRIPRQNGGAM